MVATERIEQLLKIAGAVGAIFAFVFGVIKYFDDRSREIENARIEVSRPFLERQLALCTDVTRAAAVIATSDDAELRTNAARRFWELYFGELVLVEDDRIAGAMSQFKSALDPKTEKSQRETLSLRLARACRDSLADSWGVAIWRHSNAKQASKN